MDRTQAIRAAVTALGLGVFREMPYLTREPWSHIDDLRGIAATLPRWQGKDGNLSSSEARDISQRFAQFLEEPRLPKGAAALATILEYMSLSLPKRTRRAMWLRLAQNPKAFVRKRYIRLLREGLTQREADVIWQLHCDLNDEGSLHALVMANVNIRLAPDAVEEVSDLSPPPFVLSHAIAHMLYETGPSGLEPFRRAYPIACLYAIGYSTRAEFVPYLISILKNPQSSVKEQDAALWSLARIGNPKDILHVVGGFLTNGV